MMGHKVCFYGERYLIIPILSPLPLLIWSTVLLCPHHKMAEGHIESYLSVCVCLCVPESCPGHNLVVHDGICK